MIRCNTAIRRLATFRFWTAILSFAVSGCLVQQAQADYGHMPLFFIENRGQADRDIRYMVQRPGLAAFFEAGGVSIAAGDSAFRIRFSGANPYAVIEGVDPLPGRVNFLIGPKPVWKTDVATFGSVVYRDIYPGIDLVYSGSGENLKSQFVVSPGADPGIIRLSYEMVDQPRIESDGVLVLPTKSGQFRENAPVIYQDHGGRHTAIEGAYRILRDGTVAFRIGPYDRTQPLIIDPVLTYSTYLGGGGMDAVTSIAVDGAGNAYLAGWTTSIDFPTVNPIRPANGGGVDAFVAKLNAGGNGLVYCTYLGGRGDDRAFGVAVDSSGNAYVTGWTSSTAFPTAAPVQSSLSGSRDAFVAKLNSSGNALIYSTYLGGSANDTGASIAVDSAGNAYIAGSTYSYNFPTLSAYQTSNRGQQNAFVSKFNPFGGLVYSTYLGGNGTDGASGIAVDSSGNAYITGGTTSTNFPVASAFQPASGGNQDAFVTKLGPSGNTMVYSSYLGGSGGASGTVEAGTAIAVDSAGAAYIAGATSSTNFPITAGAPQSVNMGGGEDAFVAKVNPAGNALVYCTYLGGSSFDFATGIAVDFLRNAYVTGYTASYDFVSLRALQPANAGSYDAFVTTINPAGTAILSSTYLGGSGSDSANAIALDPVGNIYVAGMTQSLDFPVKTPFQNFNGGSYGGFISKISPGWLAGVFLNGSWYLDGNRNGSYDGTVAGDQMLNFGQAGDIPVVGDWSGSGTVKVGVFRSGQWLLDYNGNGVWDGVAGGDRLYNFGQAGDIPVVGDWTGTGTAKIGVFRGGYWMLDANGNGQWDGAGTGDTGFWFGNSSYKPVVGDWSGSGTSKAGLFINGTWYLDTNGDGQWVSGVDQAAYFGQPGDIPVVGDWSGWGKSCVGVFRSGYWIVDMNANGLLDGIGIGEVGFWLGNSSFVPVVMR